MVADFSIKKNIDQFKDIFGVEYTTVLSNFEPVQTEKKNAFVSRTLIILKTK